VHSALAYKYKTLHARARGGGMLLKFVVQDSGCSDAALAGINGLKVGL
jgi:hypothetical protein